jgi:glycosyltransferase involved in cell wall biosynthesis
VTLLAPVERSAARSRVQALARLGVDVRPVVVSETRPAIVGRLARGLLRGQPLIQGLHYDGAFARELRQVTAAQPFDIVHVEHSFMAPYLDWIDPTSLAKKVLTLHNVESLRFHREMHVARWGTRKMALAIDHTLFGSWEAAALRRFDGITAVSAVERGWAHAKAPHAEVALVPNGVNLAQFEAPEPAAARRIVFTGLMNYPPNIDAVEWFSNAIFPIVRRRVPDVQFSIVGDKPTARVRALARRPGIDVTGPVPDVRPLVAGAGLVVVPLRSGAGTRLKILEAMAMRRPVVSTTVGAEGLEATPGVHLLIGDTPEAFAAHVSSLLAGSQLRDRLGREGRRFVEAHYDWRLCFRELDGLYERLTGIPAADTGVREAVAR